MPAALAARASSEPSPLSPFQDFRGDHQYVVDYLAAEVLQLQPGPIRDFLLQTAILDTMNGSLCDATTGGSNGQAILEQLHGQNLFITALNRRGQYRYHQLFADFLRDQLRRDPSHDPLPRAHPQARPDAPAAGQGPALTTAASRADGRATGTLAGALTPAGSSLST